jgi:hypothetical protein
MESGGNPWPPHAVAEILNLNTVGDVLKVMQPRERVYFLPHANFSGC